MTNSILNSKKIRREFLLTSPLMCFLAIPAVCVVGSIVLGICIVGGVMEIKHLVKDFLWNRNIRKGKSSNVVRTKGLRSTTTTLKG